MPVVAQCFVLNLEIVVFFVLMEMYIAHLSRGKLRVMNELMFIKKVQPTQKEIAPP